MFFVRAFFFWLSCLMPLISLEEKQESEKENNNTNNNNNKDEG